MGFLRQWVKLLILNCRNSCHVVNLGAKWIGFEFHLFRQGMRKGNSPLVSAISEGEKWAGCLVSHILFLMQCGGSLQGSLDIAANEKAYVQKNFLTCIFSVISWPSNESTASSSLSGLELRAGVGISGILFFLTWHQIGSSSFKSRSKIDYSTFTVVFNNCIADSQH